MLTDSQRNLWEAYEVAERRAARAQKLRALDIFLDALVVSPTEKWFPWARKIAEQVVDHGKDFVIRKPLFELAVFPALLAGYHAHLPGCARWLAGLSTNLGQCRSCREQLAPEESTELGLLWAALRDDSSDRRSRSRLIDKIAYNLNFSLHELPSGVLYGMDGATPEQCEELEMELEEFCLLVAQEQQDKRYEKLIGACRFHFRAYRDYLVNPDRYGSYAEYLDLRSPGLKGT